MSSLILTSATRFLLPLLLLFSIFLLLRGHHEPGGGFAGGLVAAAAFVLHTIAAGADQASQVVRVRPRAMIGAGLLLAVASGVLGVFAGAPFMTGQWARVGIPGLAQVEVGTPLLFDVGVYLVVIGVTLTIIVPLSEE